jgi:hypothetical protein
VDFFFEIKTAAFPRKNDNVKKFKIMFDLKNQPFAKCLITKKAQKSFFFHRAYLTNVHPSPFHPHQL